MAPPFSKALKQLGHEDPSIRIRALRELAQLKATECLIDIIGLIEKDPNDDVKVEAVRVLGQIQDINAGPTLLRILTTDDIPMVMEAVVALGILGAHGFTDGLVPLERLLNHSHFTVRKYAGYTGRNPKTGEQTQVKPKKLPLFKVGKELREAVDEQKN